MILSFPNVRLQLYDLLWDRRQAMYFAEGNIAAHMACVKAAVATELLDPLAQTMPGDTDSAATSANG